VSKNSIRQKIDEAKKKTQAALSSGKASPDILVAVESLLLIIEILAAVFLEKKTRKNSSNSGLPPSKNEGSNGNRNQGSGQRTEVGESASNNREVETSETVTPLECSRCGENLEDVEVKGTDERKKIDVIYEIISHTVTSEFKECPGCHKLNKGIFPEGMDGKVQYGNGIKAAIINYIVVQMMSLQRVQEHMMGMIGRCISQSIMLKYLVQLSDSLKGWEKRKIEELMSCQFIHCDETSVRINKVLWWIHSYSSGNITLKFVHPKRGIEAIEHFGIIPRYGGIIIHDCWASYLHYTNLLHALCGAHLLRELKFIEDSCEYTWATMLKILLQEAAERVRLRPIKRVLTAKEFKQLRSEYRKILRQALLEMPPFPEKSGKRGRTKMTDAQNLWSRLSSYEDSVLMFARVKCVDFTNNRAERDLRMCKVKQKVAGCFRTEHMAKAFYRISSYIKSMRYEGYSAVEAISLALQGKIPS
jgi:transposase